MIIPRGDGTFDSGIFDVIIIYFDVEKKTFHPAVYEEHPMPGPVVPYNELTVVRLRSKMSHTNGFATLAEAQENIKNDLQPVLNIPDSNVIFDPPFDWNGEKGDTIITENWQKPGHRRTFSEVILGQK